MTDDEAMTETAEDDIDWQAIWSEFGATGTLPVKSVVAAVQKRGYTSPQAYEAINRACAEGVLESVPESLPPSLRRL